MKSKITLILILFSVSLFGQNWIKVDSLFTPSGVGVFHFTSPCFADMNNDGLLDLFLGNSDVFAKFYLNTGESTPPKYTEEASVMNSIYANGAMGTNSDYPVAVDLDGDGDKDLVISGYNGILYYKNVGTDLPEWEKVDKVFTGVNAAIGSDAKPGFADLDDDGDFDLFVGTGESLMGGPEAGIILSYRNIGTVTEPEFELDETLSQGIPDIGLNAYPVFADMNADGKADLLLGRDLKALVYYENTGTSKTPVWTNKSSAFAFADDVTYWKNPQLVDIDYDNDFDLIYGTDGGRLYMYENRGDSTSFNFVRDASYFKVIKNGGSGATCSFADFDGDGDQDFVSGDWYGHFNYLENIGTASSPSFKLTNNAFTNLSTASSYSSPVLHDLDDDGDLDVVAGCLNGEIECWINNNGSYSKNTTMFAGIDVGMSSYPDLADFDGDGDMDLVVCGEDAGTFAYYENDGTNTFTKNTEVFAGVDFPSRIAVSVGDPDADGDMDVILGDLWGELTYIENVGTATEPSFEENTELFDGIEVDQGSNADFADLNGDGKPDMIIAEYNGSFTYYINNFVVTDVEDTKELVVDSYQLKQNYPNPFNPATTIEYALPDAGMVNITVYNVLGEKVATLVNEELVAGTYTVNFDASELTSGLYIYTLNTSKQSISKKMMLLK